MSTEPRPSRHDHIKHQVYMGCCRSSQVTKCAMEFALPNRRRPDVLMRRRRQILAIEIQRAELSEDEICQRTEDYASGNVPVLWIIGKKPPRDGAECRPKAWERWLHGLNFGRVFYWLKGRIVQEVQYRRVTRFNPPAYNIDGEEVGGYEYTLKKTRRAKHVRQLDIIVDMGPVKRASWKGYPSCMLWSGSDSRRKNA